MIKYLKNKILFTLFLLILVSCKNTCPTVTSIYKGNDKYSSYEFKLNAEDSTFLFKKTNGAGTIYSYGKWNCADNNLILTSDSPESFFKDVVPGYRKIYYYYVKFDAKRIRFNKNSIIMRSDSLINFENRKIRLVKQ